MIGRRDALRLLFATTAGVVIMSSVRDAAMARIAVPRSDVAHPKKGLADMTQDLAKLAAEHFEPLVGETFTVGQYQLTLRDVRRKHRTGLRFREQFAITFKVPRDLPIRSEVLPVAHPAIGRHDLLITQVIDEIDGTALEICFS